MMGQSENSREVGAGLIELVQGDITGQRVGAMVTAANSAHLRRVLFALFDAGTMGVFAAELQSYGEVS